MKTPQVVEKYVQCWEEHDLEGWLSTFATDGAYAGPGAAPMSGSQLRDAMAEFFSAFPSWSCQTIGTYAVEENLAVWRWMMTATHSGGAFRGTAPTGRSFSVPGVEFIQIKDGKVFRADGYYDRLTLLAQLGLLPAPSQSQ